jgi:hypothetical protein
LTDVQAGVIPEEEDENVETNVENNRPDFHISIPGGGQSEKTLKTLDNDGKTASGNESKGSTGSGENISTVRTTAGETLTDRSTAAPQYHKASPGEERSQNNAESHTTPDKGAESADGGNVEGNGEGGKAEGNHNVNGEGGNAYWSADTEKYVADTAADTAHHIADGAADTAHYIADSAKHIADTLSPKEGVLGRGEGLLGIMTTLPAIVTHPISPKDSKASGDSNAIDINKKVAGQKKSGVDKKTKSRFPAAGSASKSSADSGTEIQTIAGEDDAGRTATGEEGVR